MKLKNKWIKTFSILGLAAIALPSSIMLASCSNTINYPDTFAIATPNDLFSKSKVPLAPSFVDATSTTSFNSVFGRIMGYTNIGDYEYDKAKKEWNKTQVYAQLELAKKIVIWYEDNTSSIASNTDGLKSYTIEPSIDNGPSSDKNSEQKSPFLNENSDGKNYLDMNSIGEYLAKVKKVEVYLNEKFSWVDKNGVERQKLVPKDFWVSLEAYKKSVDYKFNSNGYFLDMAGIDYEITINDTANQSDGTGSKNGNTENKFTYYIKETQSPYLLDIFQKQYFFPMPHSHPDSQFVYDKPSNGNKNVALAFNGNTFDAINTNWDKVYGGNQKNNLDVWSVGPYYVQSISLQDVVLNVNKNYYEAMKGYSKDLDINTAIPKVVLKYNAGSPEVMYNRFKSGELSYVPVPAAQNQNAVLKYHNMKNSPLKALPAPKTPQANIASYNMQIYGGLDDNGKPKIKDGIPSSWVKFIENFHTEDAKKIRRGINELINWGRLAEFKYGQGIRDYNMSSIPYGILGGFKIDDKVNLDYYDLIAKGDAYTPNNFRNSEKIDTKGLIGGQYKKMATESTFLFDSGSEGINKSSFIQSLTNLGFTSSNPLTMQFWTLSQANDPKDLAYFTEVSNQISILSNGAMTFEYIPYNQNTTSTVYYNKAATSGSFLWGPDYNGIGTWIGFYFQYKYDKDGPVFAIPDAKNNQNFDKYKNQDVLTPYFHVANFWKPLYEELDKPNLKKDSWQKSLRDHLSSKKAVSFNSTTNGTQNETKHNYTSIKSTLDTEISIWAGINTNNGMNLLAWLDAQAPILPTFLPGLNYQSLKLVDPQYDVILNVNGDMNYKDFKKKTI